MINKAKEKDRARKDSVHLRSNSGIVDLESGGTSSEDDEVKGFVLAGQNVKKKLGRLRSGSLSSTGPSRNGDGFSSIEDVLDSIEKLDILASTVKEDGVLVKEKTKTRSFKKPSKPPRPPRGPSLDAADMKLVREISELAKLKHARIERMKALKNKRAEKTSSSTSNIFAMAVTILFLFVIIFQGVLGSRI